ncbi:hypothetical protein NW762_010579 [Fusarium torreyae]|uniref:Uncharacterized protein n=1 Tax=Fusarium torreyae TaxID=1237075 RepID=A0A9W8VDB5_9HYPO|nr:hypothetical protein NW762_010579 [Fusarium torreyae]
MRFSLQSLALFLVSTQAGFALAGPCKPLTTTTLAATSTAEATSTTAIVEESTTTTAIAEDTTTTTLSEVITTTTLAETTTTVAATTTTTTAAPEGTAIVAVLSDGTISDTYLTDNLILSNQGDTPARFTLEDTTGRLTTTTADGTKYYLQTVIPLGAQLAFMFDTYEGVANNQYRYFVTCEVVAGFLSCQSESGSTPIYWHIESNNYFYGNKNVLTGVTTAQFRFQ